MIRKIAILGAGQWGTAIGHLLASVGHTVTLLGRDDTGVSYINDSKTNPTHLPGIELHSSLVATTELMQAMKGAEIVFLAIPSSRLGQSVVQLREYIVRHGYNSHIGIVVNLAKGLESATGFRPSQIIEREFRGIAPPAIVTISGPNFATEIANNLPATTTVAGSEEAVKQVCLLFKSTTIKTFPSDDLPGVEMASVIKNVIAIACGVSDGLGLGNNARAALIEQGFMEMRDMVLAAGGKLETLFSPAGIGDLVLTCTSPNSRNWQTGFLLSQGRSSTSTTEGADSVAALYALAQELLPQNQFLILRTVYNLVQNQHDAKKEINYLWSRLKLSKSSVAL